MSLIAWWPLTGHTNCLGTKSGELQASASSVTYAQGKLGQSMYTGSLTLTEAQWNKIIGNTISIAMWIYTRSDGTFSAGVPFFGYGTMTPPKNRKFTMFHYPNKVDFHCSWQTDDSSGTYWGCSYANFFPLDEWIHLCIVQDAKTSTITVYKNGDLFSTSTVNGLANLNIKSATSAPIRASIDYQQTNDIRIYDHALSPAEVKEISKAMIMHYSFDDELIEPVTNIDPCKDSMTNKQLVNFSGGGLKSLTYGHFYGHDCFEVYLNQSSITSWTGCYLNSNPVTQGAAVGDTVTRSCWMFVPSGQTKPEHFTESIEGTPSNQKFINYDMTKPNTWQRISQTGTITSASGTNNFLHYFMAQSSGSVDFKFYIRDFQMEINSHATPYTASSRNSCLYNETGLAQPTNITNVAISDNSGSGKFSLKCSNTWIRTMSSTENQTYITLAAWVNPTSYSGDCVIIGGCYLTVNSSGKLSAYCYGKSPAGYHNGSTTIPTNAWTHIAVVWDGSYCIGYVNGNQDFKVASTGSANSSNHDKKDIGMENGNSRVFNGLIDDARVYNTALNADEIRDLYRTKAYISNFGDIMSDQFVENFENIIDEVGFNKAASSTSGNGTMELRNGVLSYGLAAPVYWVAGNSQASNMIFNGKFKANTQYYFDLWIDADSMWYSGGSIYVPCGFTLLYTDGTVENLIVTSTNGADGWKHLEFFSNSSKSIHGLGVYYYIGEKWYLRHDSGIYEVDKDGAQITSKKTVETTQALVTDFENNAMIHMSGSVIGRNIIEI